MCEDEREPRLVASLIILSSRTKNVLSSHYEEE